MTTYSVIIRHDRGELPDHVVTTGATERHAERVADGASRNLDWDNWHIAVEEES